MVAKTKKQVKEQKLVELLRPPIVVQPGAWLEKVDTTVYDPEVVGYSIGEAAKKLRVSPVFVETMVCNGHLTRKSHPRDSREMIILPGDVRSLEELVNDKSPEAVEHLRWIRNNPKRLPYYQEPSSSSPASSSSHPSPAPPVNRPGGH
jgi:hypothetical protein